MMLVEIALYSCSCFRFRVMVEDGIGNETKLFGIFAQSDPKVRFCSNFVKSAHKRRTCPVSKVGKTLSVSNFSAWS